MNIFTYNHKFPNFFSKKIFKNFKKLFGQALNSYDRGAVLENDHRYIKESGALTAVH
jgi:hypothetical protein